MAILIHSVAELGILLRQRRKALGYTQVQVADLCGTGTRFISDLESGKATIEMGKALMIASTLGIDFQAQARDPSS